jgi:hypothetical protein
VQPRIIENTKSSPALSLILCSRNDEYMGNSRWRLETALNYVADQIETLGREQEVEVLVADWGSEIPLRDVLQLSRAAAKIVSFILIPPEIARLLQQDSPFPEVLALNAAARRARGTYIGRIDQDTLVGFRFLDVFFQLNDGRRKLEVPLNQALLYSNRRSIPYWFAVGCPDGRHVAKFIRLLGSSCSVKRARSPNKEFWTYFVGIWLIHRDLWTECGGYDESFIYYNWMEVEMILRLSQKYTLVDLGKIVDYDFYHLDHLNPRVKNRRCDIGHRENLFDNPHPVTSPLPYHPNSASWGLAELRLEAASALKAASPLGGWSDNIVFTALIANTGVQLTLDTMYSFLARTLHPWTKRARAQIHVWTSKKRALRG